MPEKKVIWFWIFFVLGLLLIAAAIAFNGSVPKAVGGVCIGVGGALVGVMANKLLLARMLNKNPQMRRKMRIDETDERNVAINARAKAKAFDTITPVFFVVALATVLLGAELVVTLLIVGGYAVSYIVYFVYVSKYNKEM